VIKETEKKFIRGLSDDLNISVSLTALFSLIKNMNILISQEKIKTRDAQNLLSFVDSVNTVLGVIKPTIKRAVSDSAAVTDEAKVEVQPSAEDLAKIRLREQARAERNYQLADQIRRELEQHGILLEDTKDGVRWKILASKKQTE
jgi:cysteinyl-tRNA synthetase